MISSQLPVDATQGGIILATTRGSRQMEQQPLDIVNSGRGQVAPLPVVTADGLTPDMEFPKDDSGPLPGTVQSRTMRVPLNSDLFRWRGQPPHLHILSSRQLDDQARPSPRVAVRVLVIGLADPLFHFPFISHSIPII